MKKWRRAINFDLDTKALIKHHPKHNTTSAYTEIEQFLIKRDFTHTQYSGYFSNNPLSNIELSILANELYREFPWLKICSHSIYATNIGETLNLELIVSELELDHNINIEEELLETDIDEEIEL